jgi:hypothetical protein
MTCSRWGCARSIAAGCIVAGTLFCSVSTAAQAAPRCVVHGHSVPGVRTSKVVTLTGNAIVYRTRFSHEGKEVQDVWACGRRSDRFVLVAAEESQPGYYEGTISGIRVAGSWVVATQETELIAGVECEKYESPGEQPLDCPSAVESLLFVDVASGLEGSLSGKSLPGMAYDTLLSSAGALAWWVGPEATSSLYGCAAFARKHALACKPRLVAQGSIPEASVSLMGTTLSWTDAGQTQSGVL